MYELMQSLCWGGVRDAEGKETFKMKKVFKCTHVLWLR